MGVAKAAAKLEQVYRTIDMILAACDVSEPPLTSKRVRWVE